MSTGKLNVRNAPMANIAIVGMTAWLVAPVVTTQNRRQFGVQAAGITSREACVDTKHLA